MDVPFSVFSLPKLCYFWKWKKWVNNEIMKRKWEEGKGYQVSVGYPGSSMDIKRFFLCMAGLNGYCYY